MSNSSPKVTVRQDFECMYILDKVFSDSDNHDIELNAHRYRFEVSVEKREDDESSRVVEFSDLQKSLNSILPDESYIYQNKLAGIPAIIGGILDNAGAKCVHVDFEICAESLCSWLIHKLQQNLDDSFPKKFKVVDAILRENSQCYVSWHIDE